MTNWRALLLSALLVTVSSTSFGQETEQKVRPYGAPFTTTITIMCNDTDIITKFLLDKKGQYPITVGLIHDQNGVARMMPQVYANPQTRTWTWINHTSSTPPVSCLIFKGEDFDILLPMNFGMLGEEQALTP